jgi:1-deoxy-D-xylulose-5-phosphate synthase
MTDLLTLTPAILKQMPIEALLALAAEIRTFLIDTVSKTGGHIGANLGTVELTLALHYVFDSPRDKLLWDTGHSAYTHRIVTGRADQFPTLNMFGGMSRFLQCNDSEHDIMEASHAGTAISTAVGLAQAMQMAGDAHRVIAIVGDGTLGEGLTWEGLNYLAGTSLPVMIVLNDNGMAIAPIVGGIANVLTPEGGTDYALTGDFFRALGMRYHGPFYGHDCSLLVHIFQGISQPQGPRVIHVKTEKGRGLPSAATHPYKMHFSMSFDPATGAGASATVTGRTFATAASETLGMILANDPDVVVLTPGTPYASALESLLLKYPTRVLDVGMAEQHGVSMAAGLALGGKKPVVCFQSTFMQRAYDQILHDVCSQNLPVTFLCVRSGFAGYDGPTHHGLWDIPILRGFPNLALYYAANTNDMSDILVERLGEPCGPLALLMPYEPIKIPEPVPVSEGIATDVMAWGEDGVLFCLGNMIQTALDVRRNILHTRGKILRIIAVKSLVPFPRGMVLEHIRRVAHGRVATLEEGILAGGFGSLVLETVAHMNTGVLGFGVTETFVLGGSKEECAASQCLDTASITQRIITTWWP